AEAAGVAIALALMIAAREMFLPRLPAYRRAISRVPLSWRILAGLAISALIGRQIIAAMWDGPYQDTFRPILIGTTMSLVIFTMLLPKAAGRHSASVADMQQADAGARR